MLTISALRIAAAKQDLLTVDTDACVLLDIQGNIVLKVIYTRYFYHVLNPIFHREIKVISMIFGSHSEIWWKSQALVGLKTLKIPA